MKIQTKTFPSSWNGDKTNDLYYFSKLIPRGKELGWWWVGGTRGSSDREIAISVPGLSQVHQYT